MIVRKLMFTCSNLKRSTRMIFLDLRAHLETKMLDLLARVELQFLKHLKMRVHDAYTILKPRKS
jgi:hypothetical protein